MLATVMVACGDVDRTESPWAVDARRWAATAVDPVGSEPETALTSIWHPEVFWDIRSMIAGSAVLHGQNAFTLGRALHQPGAFTIEPPGLVLVSTDGMVLTTYATWGALQIDHVDTASPAHLVHVFDPIGPEGVEHLVTAMAIDDRRARRFGDNVDDAQALERQWREVWAADGTISARQLYGPEAVVRDSIAGVEASGNDQIAALSTETGWRDIELVRIDGTGPALYPLITSDGSVRGLIMVVDVDTCPGRMAVMLELDDGLVVTEHRYRSVADTRFCLPADQLPPGWWSDLPHETTSKTPATQDPEGPTGHLASNGWIEICNGTPALEAFAQWGIDRFELASLPAPPVSSLTFVRDDACCDYAQGTTTLKTGRYDVVLCLDETMVCADEDCATFDFRARRALLHEFAHVWMASHLDETDRTVFTALVDLDHWHDPDVAWNERAVEHAAETIAWGLLDEPFAPILIGRPPPEELTEHFRFLTGVDPLQPTATDR